MSDNTYTIICLDVKTGHPSSVVAGSIIDKCATCNGDVWIAPSGVKIRYEKKAKTICVPCVMKMARPDKIMPLTADQRKEIEDHG